MSGGFKWLEIPGGMYMVVANEEGKILAHVHQAPKCPAIAFVGDRRIGWYVSNESARLAVEAEMSDVRRYQLNASMNAGKPVEPLPMDERAWIEDQ